MIHIRKGDSNYLHQIISISQYVNTHELFTTYRKSSFELHFILLQLNK